MGGPWFRRRESLNCWINSAVGWVVIVFALLLPFYFLRSEYVIFKPLIKGAKC